MQTMEVKRVHYTGDDGVLRSIRRAWTSVACEDPFARVASGRSAFRVLYYRLPAAHRIDPTFRISCPKPETAREEVELPAFLKAALVAAEAEDDRRNAATQSGHADRSG